MAPPAHLPARPPVPVAVDLLVIGGGINGAGIARDAAGRGLSVALVERDDLAGHTSSASSKLVHGGIRYLEQYEFALVRKALKEREALRAIAPHIVWPLRFVLPHEPKLRSGWMIRTGLFLYDHLDLGRRLPASQAIDLDEPPYAGLLDARYAEGFEYSDCWIDDARMVALNAVDAAAHGATILTQHRCTALARDVKMWRATIATPDGSEAGIVARAVVNAAGPWVGDIMVQSGRAPRDHAVRLVKGSHIVVPRTAAFGTDTDRAFIFQNADRRIVFALPFEDDFTLIGTTDAPAPPSSEIGAIAISPEERAYLLGVASAHLARELTEDDIVWSYAGVRSLYDDGSADASDVTRNYVLQVDGEAHQAPILHVIGGKITTFRRLAEDALRRLAPWLGDLSDDWTARAPLPGGDIDASDPFAYADTLVAHYPGLPPTMLARLARSYGSVVMTILGDAATPAALGRHFGADLYEAELSHLVDREFARCADDVVWRRTKLGLRLSATQLAAIDDWIAG